MEWLDSETLTDRRNVASVGAVGPLYVSEEVAKLLGRRGFCDVNLVIPTCHNYVARSVCTHHHGRLSEPSSAGWLSVIMHYHNDQSMSQTAARGEIRRADRP